MTKEFNLRIEIRKLQEEIKRILNKWEKYIKNEKRI